MSIYIGIITQNERQNIAEMLSIASHFDGVAAVDHFSTDGTYELLDQYKGDGFVERIPYYSHHAHSMNHFLLNPKVKLGDWLLLRDSSERIAESFAKDIRHFVQGFEENGVNTVYQQSKLLMFRRFPQQFFSNTPHWSLQGARSGYIQIDKQEWFKSDLDYCYSVRSKRDAFHFVSAYLRYYLILDSNHNLLGNVNRPHLGDEITIFHQREKVRVELHIYLRSKGVPLTVAGFKDYVIANPRDPELMRLCSLDKIPNDAYRYFALNDQTVQDEHEWSSLKVIS